MAGFSYLIWHFFFVIQCTVGHGSLNHYLKPVISCMKMPAVRDSATSVFRISCLSNQSIQIQEIHTAYSAGTQNIRSKV